MNLTPKMTAIMCSLIALLLSFSTWAHQPILLTVEASDGYQKTYTRADLGALPQTEFTAKTPWSNATHTYQGPKLSLILADIPTTFSSIRAYAINDYSTDLSPQDLLNYPFILALKQDGKNMSLRNKGPIWILIPFDRYPEASEQPELLNKMAWQVERIKVK